MNKTIQLNAESCRAYQALCSFCSWGLFADPADQLKAFVADRALFLEEPFSQIAPSAAQELHDVLAAGEGEGFDALAREVHLDRTYLFYMIGASHTSPYESVYRTDDSTVFGPTTLEVRAFYKAHGLRFDRSETEPDDHIGIELAFAAHLLDAAATAFEAGDDQAAAKMLDELRVFLSDHVLVFSPMYLGNVQRRAKSPFYRAVAGIAEGAISELADVLGAVASDSIVEARYYVD